MSESEAGNDRGRRAMVSVRLSPEEEAALKAEAAEKGKSLSQYVREVLLQQGDAASGAVDLRLFPTTTTTVSGGLAVEAEDGRLVPRMTTPYVTPMTPA